MHSIQGNHDQAACNPIFAEGFNILARSAILWTRNNLTDKNIHFLNGLEESRRLSCGLACHGSPENTASYIALPFQARAILKKMKKGIWGKINFCLFGHIPPDGTIRLNDEDFYLLNPGSVGQPRNGEPRSSYCILDTEKNSVTFKLVEYDILSTMKKIVVADLPEFFAKRLLNGT
ncbi:MAG: metallophosphoesterase family protein [Deltaproteobacteria bacterium]|nr:metallophosphoesterase family protein [Deltaproteobacteria bacterium]